MQRHCTVIRQAWVGSPANRVGQSWATSDLVSMPLAVAGHALWPAAVRSLATKSDASAILLFLHEHVHSLDQTCRP